MTENKKSAIRTIAVVLLLFFILTAGYLAVLEAIVPHSGLRFLPGWEDHTFSTASNKSLVWSDTNFENSADGRPDGKVRLFSNAAGSR